MNQATIAQIVTIIGYAILGFSALYGIAHFIVLEYRNYTRSNSPILTDRAVAYHKHSEQVHVAQGFANSAVFFITFHTDGGLILKLYMNSDQFYIIREGQTGQLIWQGDSLCRFTPDPQ